MTFSNTTSFLYFRCFILECLDSTEIFQFESFINPQVYRVSNGRDWLFVTRLFHVLLNRGLILDWILLCLMIMGIKPVW